MAASRAFRRALSPTAYCSGCRWYVASRPKLTCCAGLAGLCRTCRRRGRLARSGPEVFGSRISSRRPFFTAGAPATATG